MPISKTSGISLSEINSFLSKGNNISAYYDEHYLDTKRNTSKIFKPDRPISFGAFDNLDKLPDADVILPLVELTSQGGSGTYFKGDGADITLSIVLKAKKNSEPQPTLSFNAAQRPHQTVIKWYETTGGAFTEMTSVTSTVALPKSWVFRERKQPEYIFRSMLKIPKDTTGTRTFVARAEVFTYNNDTNEVAGSAITTFDPYTITISEAGEPELTAQVQVPGVDSSGTIITYTDGSATSYPAGGVGFNYTFSEGSSPGYILTDRSESHVSYVSYNGGAFVASTASGVGPYGPFHQSHDPTRSPKEFGYWVRAPIEYTVPGEYRFKLISSVSNTFTKPDGTTGYVITATDEGIHTATIGSKTIDNAVPTLLGWTISENSISENGGVATVTLNTQHAIGEDIVLAASENMKGNLNTWGKTHKISANSMTFTFTSKASNNGNDRTLTLYATPQGTEWDDATMVSDTVTLTNSGEPTLLDGYGMNGVNSVNEGGSFTYTLKGINFQEENYTWSTTFPAASVVATSGSFSTPYAGGYWGGNYHGTFTVDTVERTDHYQDVTGGQIKVYRNGQLYTQSGANLTIKNTTAQPVTLPTSNGTAPLAHSRMMIDTTYPEGNWFGVGSVSITLNKDSTWTSSSGQRGTYATPAPLEGDWVPVIASAGPIAKLITQEDITNIPPGGGMTFTQEFSQSTATLKVKGDAAQSIIGSGSCTFTYIFKNTVSKEVRTGGVLNLSLHIHAIPSKGIVVDIIVVENPLGVVVDDTLIYGPTEVILVDKGVEPVVVTDVEQVVVTEVHPTRGGLIRTYCGKNSIKWGAYHDGAGGHFARIIERNSVECGYISPFDDSGIKAGETYEPEIDVTTQTYAAGGTGTDQVNQNIYDSTLAEIDEQVRQNVQDAIAENGIPDLTNVLAGIKVDIGAIKIDIGSISIGSL